MRVGGRQGLDHVGPYKPEWTWEISLSARLVLRWGRGPNPSPPARGSLGRADGHGLGQGGWVTGAKLTCRTWSMAPSSVEAPPVPGEAVRPSTCGSGPVLWSLSSRYRLKMML